MEEEKPRKYTEAPNYNNTSLNLSSLKVSPNRNTFEASSVNPFADIYRSDMKYYNEYLESCQKALSSGINMKWPYCFGEDEYSD